MSITLLIALREFISYTIKDEADKTSAKCNKGRKLIELLDEEIKRYA